MPVLPPLFPPPKIFSFFTDENTAQGLPAGTGTYPQAGITDVDDGSQIEKGFTLDYPVNPEFTWIDYRCTIETWLDPGIAVHKPLPQGNPPAQLVADSLGVADVASTQLIGTSGVGVRTVSIDNFGDVPQKMATSKYIFRLRGHSMRVAYQVPIPSLVMVAGVPAVPEGPQWAVNEVVGNYGGVPLFFAQWDLWYTVVLPPTKNVLPPTSFSQHIRADAELPSKGMQVPFGPVDSDATAQDFGGGQQGNR